MIAVTGGPPFSVMIDAAALIDFGGAARKGPAKPPRPSRQADMIWQDTIPLPLDHLGMDSQLAPYLGWTIAELEHYTGIMTDDPYGWTVLGVRLYQTNRLEESAAALAKARRADPFYERSAELYSAIVIHAGDPERAQKEVRRMLDELPHNPVLRFNAACGYARQTNVAEALYHLEILNGAGWSELPFYLDDADLNPLRSSPAFQRLTEEQYRAARVRVVERLRVPRP